jgi:hypothetical protein
MVGVVNLGGDSIANIREQKTQAPDELVRVDHARSVRVQKRRVHRYGCLKVLRQSIWIKVVEQEFCWKPALAHRIFAVLTHTCNRTRARMRECENLRESGSKPAVCGYLQVCENDIPYMSSH